MVGDFQAARAHFPRGTGSVSRAKHSRAVPSSRDLGAAAHPDVFESLPWFTRIQLQWDSWETLPLAVTKAPVSLPNITLVMDLGVHENRTLFRYYKSWAGWGGQSWGKPRRGTMQKPVHLPGLVVCLEWSPTRATASSKAGWGLDNGSLSYSFLWRTLWKTIKWGCTWGV